MGLIKAAIGSLGGTLADQWKEFFYCDSLPGNILMVKGQKRTSKRSSNTKANDNVISSGSGIAVADGQCMMIVEQGKIVEVCAEPGEFTYDSSSEPSIFAGSLGKSIVDSFKTLGKRFTYGGDTGKDQRIYYVNTKEILGNKFGTPTPIPFRVVDRNIGLDVDVSVRCSGMYSYRISDPLLFYKNVAGNVEDHYETSLLDSQLKQEFVGALTPAFGRLSGLQLRPSDLPQRVTELSKLMNEELSARWGQTRGLEISTITMNPPVLPDEDAAMIKKLQQGATLRDPTFAAATLVSAQADAMRAAASNENGAMQGFMGFGMAMNAGGTNPQNLYAMGAKPALEKEKENGNTADPWRCGCGFENTGKFCQQCGSQKPVAKGGWKCRCGETVYGNFCTHCGSPRPDEDGWLCSCGQKNPGKFCSNCGSKKPEDAPLYRCDRCGWQPEDPKNPPKFCPECGDRFDENDRR